MAMENDALVHLDDVQLVDHLNELETASNNNKARTEVGPANYNIGESSLTSSALEAEASSELTFDLSVGLSQTTEEAYEVPAITVEFFGRGSDEKFYVTITSAIEALNLLDGLTCYFRSVSTNYGTAIEAAIVRWQAIRVSRQVVELASQLARESGTDENIVRYLEEVVEYMEKTAPGDASAQLQCILLYRCAKVFHQLGCTENALAACEFAQKLVAQGLPPDMKPVELAIKMLLVKIHRIHGNQMCTELRAEVNDYLENHPDNQSTPVSEIYGIDLVGFIREYPVLEFGGKYPAKSIFAYVDKLCDENSRARMAIINLTFFSYSFVPMGLEYSDYCDWLKLTIAELQRLKCSCNPDCVTYPAELFGEYECPCHQLLSDALLLLGNLQQMLGLMEEAEKSFQQSLKLAQQCKDNNRELTLHYTLYNFLCFMAPAHSHYSDQVFDDESHDCFTRAGMMYHRQNLIKCAAIPGPASGKRDIGILYGKLDQVRSLEEFTAYRLEFLKKQEHLGDIKNILIDHAQLCHTFRMLGDLGAVKKHFLLALDCLQVYYKQVEWQDYGILVAVQNLGLIANMLELEELGQYAFDLWYKVYDNSQTMLEDLEKISDEAALHYFETIKHANNQIAKHFVQRSKFRLQNVKPNDMVNWTQTYPNDIVNWARAHPEDFKEMMENVKKSLVWSERGKGRMLMSFIGVVQKNPDQDRSKGGSDHSRLLEKLNLPPDYPDNFESRFSRNDSFALEFIQRRSMHLPKMVFVEYTFVDHVHLMIYVTDGSEKLSVMTIDLSRAISEDIRREAEAELDSFQFKPSGSNKSEVGNQSFPDPRSSIAEGLSSRAADVPNKVLSAMNKYGINRVPFNRWIPGMVAGIQRRVAEAQSLRKINKSFHKEEKKVRQLLQVLYSILIQPLERYLFGETHNPGHTLVFVPHEDLGVVPFPALHEKDGSAYLFEQYVISVSPAIWCSRHCEYLYEKKVHCDPVKDKLAVLVGRKSGYPTPSFSDLKDAHKEVAAVAEALGRVTTCTVVLDNTPEMSTGMKERVTEILPNASWIHLAVHGEISPQFPQGSLLFGENNEQRLTATEIITSSMSSPWSARCVIASACQSGLGSVAGGGIMGFARSFILAGIPSCVLSMWEVNEAFCTSFMARLYGELQSGETVGDAVKNAMNIMMKEKKAPRSSAPKSKRVSRFAKSELSPQLSDEPMWSILDWAAFSCFGFPGVKLPTDAIESAVRDIDRCNPPVISDATILE